MKTLLTVALLWPLLGCPAATGPGVAGATEGCKGDGCAHGSTGSRGEAGSSSSGAASSSTASSTSSAGSSTSAGGSSSGTTEASGSNSSSTSGSIGGKELYNCTGVGAIPDGGGCPSDSLTSLAVDVLSCSPIGNATVQALDGNSIPVPGSVTTASDGSFVLCGPTGSAFTPFLTAVGYKTTYLAELQSGAHSYYGEFGILSNSFMDAVTGLLPGGFDSNLGALVAYVSTTDVCADSSGWALSLTDADGGLIPDGGFLEAYVGASGVPQPGLTATSGEGLALFYNIDLSTTNYFGVSLSKPDAGNCTPTLTTAFTTGRIYVTADSLSLYIFQVH